MCCGDIYYEKWQSWDMNQPFSCGSDSKEPAFNAADPGSVPGSGRSPGEGNGNPLQYSCLKKFHGQKSLAFHYWEQEWTVRGEEGRALGGGAERRWVTSLPPTPQPPNPPLVPLPACRSFSQILCISHCVQHVEGPLGPRVRAEEQ